MKPHKKDALILSMINKGKKQREIEKELGVSSKRIVAVRNGLKTVSKSKEEFGGWF